MSACPQHHLVLPYRDVKFQQERLPQQHCIGVTHEGDCLAVGDISPCLLLP